MIIPKYQWLIEEKESECGFCDQVYIDENSVKKFQVKFEPEVLLDEDFDGDNVATPLDVVGGESVIYEFDFSYEPVTEQAWINAFILPVDGIERCYIFVYVDDIPGAGDWNATEYGDITLIKIEFKTTVENYSNYTTALVSTLPDPITTALNGVNIQVIDLPVGTQIVPTPNYPTVSGTTDPATWSFNNFFPVNNKNCFFNISVYDEVDEPTSTPSTSVSTVVTEDNFVVITVNFINSFGFDVDMSLFIRDNAFGLLQTITKTALEGTNTLVFSFQATSPPAYYIFEFGLSDMAVYATGIGSQSTGFCFNTVLIEQVGFVETISYVDCDEEVHELEVDEWLYTYDEKYNFLIEISGFLPPVFQLIVLGNDADSFTSIWYEQINPETCRKGKVYRFEWTDTCRVGDLNYSDPDITFTNELYLTGLKTKQSSDKVEAISNITASGKKKSIYRHTIGRAEIRFHPYSANVQEALEGAFEHSILRIDGEGFYLGDGDKYDVSVIDMQIYTGRVDLYLDGSELIVSSCCC